VLRTRHINAAVSTAVKEITNQGKYRGIAGSKDIKKLKSPEAAEGEGRTRRDGIAPAVKSMLDPALQRKKANEKCVKSAGRASACGTLSHWLAGWLHVHCMERMTSGLAVICKGPRDGA